MLQTESTTLPIAEIFSSIQGEGFHVGLPMTFVRLAGCTVGRRFPVEVYQDKHFPLYVNQCTAFDGRTFPCDTDYGAKYKMSIEEILKEIPERIEWVSITGGEPLMHGDRVLDLINVLLNAGKRVHVETSGTVVPSVTLQDKLLSTFLVCSPKQGYLPEMLELADEIRLVVDPNFDTDAAEKLMQHVLIKEKVFLCPLSMQNDINRIDPKSMYTCLELIEMDAFKRCRISIQMHKILGVR